MGLPLLNGFVGEFTILQGTFMENKAWAAWAVPGVILAAAYLLWLYQRVFFGPVNNPKNEKLLDLSGRELATFVPLVAIAFWIGLYPKPFFQILSTPVNNLVVTVRPDYPGLGNKPVEAKQPGTTPAVAPASTEPAAVPAAPKPVAKARALSLPARTADPSAPPSTSSGSARDDNSKNVAARDDNSKIFAAAVNHPAAVAGNR
jgi:NADH-quinone oxidoreductase subunit M